MRILQRYVARELLKTFALTAIGLTLTFSLCGGVLNMVKAEMLTAVEMARILGFVLPVAMTLTLPVSALFSCAIVYGRLAADNEFDACKASGINIHRLLAPAMGLSVATAAFTFVFSNYVIPESIKHLEVMIRKDIQKIAFQALKSQGYFRYREEGWVLHADEANLYNTPEAGGVLSAEQATFLKVENENLALCGTAHQVQASFAPGHGSDEPVIRAVVHDLRALDIKRSRRYEEMRRPFSKANITTELKENPKWMNLPDLLHYMEHATKLTAIQKKVKDLREEVRRSLFYQYVRQQLTGGDKTLTLSDDHQSYRITCQQTWLEKDFRVKAGGDVTIRHEWTDEEGAARTRDYKADECSFKVDKGFADGRDVAILTLLTNVRFVDSIDPTQQVELNRQELDAVAVPQEIIDREADMTDDKLVPLNLLTGSNFEDEDELFEAVDDLGLGPVVKAKRFGTLIDLAKLRYDIVGIIHSRLAFSASALVMLVLAAALGIIFRGGQLLTAFVISFLPGLVVVVMNIMGRQMADKAGTHMIGIVIIWVGIGVLAILDGLVLTRYLKR